MTRGPEPRDLARALLDATAPDRMKNRAPARGSRLGTRSVAVAQRGLIVASPAAARRAINRVNQAALTQTAAEFTAFEPRCRQSFSGETDAQKALLELEKKLNQTQMVAARISVPARYRGPGRPAKQRGSDYQTSRLEGQLAARLEPHQQRLHRKRCVILATHQQDSEAFADDDLIPMDHDHQQGERGFRVLKAPLLMASALFLQAPERMMALRMVMTLCLLV